MNFGRNFEKFGDFSRARIFLTNEIQNPDLIYYSVYFTYCAYNF